MWWRFFLVKGGEFMKYEYPQITGGYRWNMMQRIEKEVGVKPTASGDSGGKTFVSFQNELTPEQKTLLDTLMANYPANPPVTTNTTFVIDDLWNRKQQIEATMGISYDIYYIESSPNSGIIDQIKIIFNKQLTNAEKNKVRNAYAGLIKEA